MEHFKRRANRKFPLVATTIVLVTVASWWPLSVLLSRLTSTTLVTAKLEDIRATETPTESVFNLTDVIVSMDLGWDHETPPQWLQDICPEVVEHYDKFPSFQRLPHPAAPFMTTEFAAQSVCTLKVARLMAASVGTKLYIHAGSHLGALLHGQVRPVENAPCLSFRLICTLTYHSPLVHTFGLADTMGRRY